MSIKKNSKVVESKNKNKSKNINMKKINKLSTFLDISVDTLISVFKDIQI